MFNFNVLFSAAPANKTVKEFEGERYIELYFHLHLRRKSFYYVVNWVIPAVLISMSNILQFMMPTGGGEKITLRWNFTKKKVWYFFRND